MNTVVNVAVPTVDFQALFESAPGRYLVLEPAEFRIVAVNDAYLKVTMTEREAIVGKPLFAVFPGPPGDPHGSTRVLRESLERVRATRQSDVVSVQYYPIERPESRGGGLEDRYWSPINTPVLSSTGDVQYIIHRAEDVTELIRTREREGHIEAAQRTLQTKTEQLELDVILRSHELQDLNEQLRASEVRLARSNRALRMHSACNEALVRVKDETSLLKDICYIAAEIGGYRMAWVGYAENDKAKSVRPVAYAGEENGYLNELTFSWDENKAHGRGPGGRAIRSGEPAVVADIAAEPGLAFYQAAAHKRGYRGIICLPMNTDGQAFGILVLYSHSALQVSHEELKLLQELADNLAYGISNIRTEQARKQLHNTVAKMAAAVSASTGMAFFQQLVLNMTETLSAHAGAVVRLLDTQPLNARVITSVVGDDIIDDYEYPMSTSPCEHLRRHDVWIESSNLATRYPDFKPALSGGKVYVGMRLTNSRAQHTGQLYVVFDTPLRQPDLIVSTLRIFAARASAELERQEADARILEQASLLNKAHDAITVRDMDHTIIFWNNGAERMYGWSAAEAVGRSAKALLYDEPHNFETAVQAVLNDGEWRGQIHQRNRNGDRLTVEGHWTLVKHKDGRPKSILAINSDISKRLAMEEQLQQAQRLKAVGELTGGVAHDFNNLLTVILGNSELLVEQLSAEPRHQELAELAEMTCAAAQQGAALTHRLLAFASRQTLEPRAVDVRTLIDGMTGLLHRTLPETIKISVTQEDELLPALVDPAQLESAILNLCINARDTMMDGGKLSIHTANAWLDNSSDDHPDDLTPGSYVAIEITDTGQGIDNDTLRRVFEPFFTTKPKGKGTGLGLSIVYGFIRQFQGHIVIQSEPDLGTTVKMYLPIARHDDARTLPVTLPHHDHTTGGAEQILLVEDDELVRRHVKNQLLALGYRVLTAVDAQEALTVIDQNTAIDLLFTDVIMPGDLNGPELVAAVHTRRPALKALLTSGYTENAILNDIGPLGKRIQLLKKPYQRAELARKIRSALVEDNHE